MYRDLSEVASKIGRPWPLRGPLVSDQWSPWSSPARNIFNPMFTPFLIKLFPLLTIHHSLNSFSIHRDTPDPIRDLPQPFRSTLEVEAVFLSELDDALKNSKLSKTMTSSSSSEAAIGGGSGCGSLGCGEEEEEMDVLLDFVSFLCARDLMSVVKLMPICNSFAF